MPEKKTKKQQKFEFHLQSAEECMRKVRQYNEQIANIELARAAQKMTAQEHMLEAKKLSN